MIVKQFYTACLSQASYFIESEGEVAIIDPSRDIDHFLEKANSSKSKIKYIFQTHFHADFVSGHITLSKITKAPIIYGPNADPSYECIISKDGDTFKVGDCIIKVIHTPGHTLGHMVYHFEEQSLAFVGDTLFAMGCGRLFEGTPEQMWSSLNIIKEWPEKTQLFCAHEYTQANAEFALTVDPDNEALLKRKIDVENLRNSNQPTVPTTLSIEKDTNPFLRSNDSNIKAHLGMSQSSDLETFAEIRKRKDNF